MRLRLGFGILALGLVVGGVSQWRLVKEVRAIRSEVTSLRSVPRSQSPGQVRTRAGSPAPLPDDPLSLEGSQTKGNKSAKAAIVVYSDFQCPYCGAFARTTWPRIEKEYVETGRLLAAFRHFPLANHEFAQGAGEAAECAARQGSFWQMHDRIFADQQRLDLVNLRSSAAAIGLDSRLYDACMKGDATGRVKTDLEGGRTLAVTGTPTFFIGILEEGGRVDVKQRFTGAKGFDQFRMAIDSVLATRNGQ